MITILVGTRIAQLRNERGESQLAFTSRIGMARTYFAEVETGKRNVSIRNLEKIVRGMNVTLAEFFDSDIFSPLYQTVNGGAYDDTRGTDYAVVDLPPAEE